MNNNTRLSNYIAFGALAVTLIGFIWKASEFRTEVRTDMSWVKTSLATLVTRFSELDTLKTHVFDIDKNGTEALKEVTAKINSFQQKVDNYERNGSPGVVKRVQDLETRIDKCERDILIHLEKTNGGKP